MPAAANHAGRTREDRKIMAAPVTEKEKERAEAKAARLGISLAELIRRAVDAYQATPWACACGITNSGNSRRCGNFRCRAPRP